MRLQVKLSTDRFPLQYRMMIVSLVKEALKASDEAYFQKIYQSNQANRPFSFGVYVHDYELDAAVFHVKGYVALNIASPDSEFMLHFYNGMMSVKEFKYKGFTLKRMKVQMESNPLIDRNQVYFKTLSPLLIQDKNKRPLHPQEDSYREELNYISHVALQGYRGYGLLQPLEFTAKNMKKTVVKENIHSGDETLFFTGYQGVFSLKGHPEDLKVLSEFGIGFRSSQGFGAVEVI